MNEEFFDSLMKAVKEVGLIEKGELAPSREFFVERNSKVEPTAKKVRAICVTSENDDLIPLKIYSVTLHPQMQKCTVKDESSETVVCPMDWFLPVELPENVERELEKVGLALA